MTCLLTRAPPAGVYKRSQYLHRGVNFVTVCVSLSASLVGYQVVCQPLWIEGKQIQPGVNVLSGPRDLSQIAIHGAPDINLPRVICVLQCIPLKTPDSVLEEETPDSAEVPGMLHTA